IFSRDWSSDVCSSDLVGADAPRYDLAEVVEAAKAQDLYMIGRIVAFQDPVAAQADPDMAVWDEQTGAPFSSNGQYFLDPTDPERSEERRVGKECRQRR